MHTINKSHQKSLEKYLKIKDIPGVYEQKLWKKTNKYKKIFSYIPGVLCVCVGNSLAMNACHKDSDIDLFIITKNNRIWTSRIILTLVLSLLGQRKTAKKHAGKFCLSFFITKNAINLENIAIKNDIYLDYWIQRLVPIVNKNETFESFTQVNIHQTAFSSSQQNSIQTPLSSLSCQERGDSKGTLGNILESLLKNIFLPRTKKSFQNLGKPFGVIITDDILKFHDKDKRKEIRDAIFSSLPPSQ